MTTYVLLARDGTEVARSENYDRLLARFNLATCEAVELVQLDGDARVVLRRRTAFTLASAREEARVVAPPKPRPEKAPLRVKAPRSTKEPKSPRAKASPRAPKPPLEPRPRKPPPEPRTPPSRDPCKHCGKPIPHSDGRYRLFCAPACKRAQDTKVSLARQKERDERAQAARVCRRCGHVGLARGRRWYCSETCEREMPLARDRARNHHPARKIRIPGWKRAA